MSERVNVNFKVLEKSIWVLEKSWKCVCEKVYESCIVLTNITDEISKKSKHAVMYFGSDSNSSRFTNEQNQFIKTQLIHLRASFSENACLLSPDHSLAWLTSHVINQIVENCESLNTEEDPSWASGCMKYQFGTRNPNYSCQCWRASGNLILIFPALYSSDFEIKIHKFRLKVAQNSFHHLVRHISW